MKKYVARIVWYLVVVAFVVLAIFFPATFIAGATLPAIAIYLPISISWILFGYLFARCIPFNEYLLGIKTSNWCISISFIGCILCISYKLFSSVEIMEFGFLLILVGVDGIILNREQRILADVYKNKRESKNYF
jgi:hypothetical protein